jgi:hypothetical protein
MIRMGPDENGKEPERPKFVFEEVTDPVQIAEGLAVDEAYGRNEAWLQEHWAEVYPKAKGKTLVVAGQEAFIADTPEEALDRAHTAHPNDIGVVRRYVPFHSGPRVYDLRG